MLKDLLTFILDLLTPCIPLQDNTRRYIACSSLKQYIASTIIPGAWHYTDDSEDDVDETMMCVDDDDEGDDNDDNDDNMNEMLSMKKLTEKLTVELYSWPGLLEEWSLALYVVCYSDQQVNHAIISPYAYFHY